MAYDAARYWGDLHDRAFDESTVGYPGLARSLNAAMYRTLLVAVDGVLAPAGLDARGRRVLDVGSGTGIWIDFWERHGAAELAGADLAESSVANLRARFPGHSFSRVDIGDEDAALPGANDIVSAMSIMLHITDDVRFARAIANLAGALAPGGALVTIDPAIVHRWWGPPFGPEATSRARPMDEYRDAMRSAGLELSLVRPATVLLSNVVDTRRPVAFRLLERYWSLLTRAVGPRERVGAAAAAVLGPLDRIAVRLSRTGPSAKILVARRPA